ncbi:MAG: hypothetical protein ABJG78_20460 [Cyclobacteriaceae bacterium]
MMRTIALIHFMFAIISHNTEAQSLESEFETAVFDYSKDVKWQKASAKDISIFDSFIGRFRSKSRFSENLKKNIHFILEYQWFDSQKTTVKLRLSYIIEETGKETVHSEGFYGFDPTMSRLYLMQTYASGVISFGGLEEFDIKTGRRLVRARSVNQQGNLNHVKDEFEVVDKDTWKNKMYSLEDDEWKVTYEDTFTRIKD